MVYCMCMGGSSISSGGGLYIMYTGNGIHGWQACVRCIGGEGLVGLNFSTRYGIAVRPGVHIFCKLTLPKG